MSTEELVARLRALLAAGGFGPGERVGDERGLAAELGVPRAALRAGLDRLAAAGLVRRTIGRSGGVIASDGRIERHLNTTESLPQIARYQGVHVDTRVLQVALGLAGAAERRRLDLAEGATVHRILRLRLADGRPLSLEASCLPADLFPGLDRADLSSLYRTLLERYGIGPVYSEETLEVVGANAEQAAHLAVGTGTGLVYVQRVATGSTGRPIELGQEWFVADRMRFHLRKYGYVKPERSPASAPPAGPHPAALPPAAPHPAAARPTTGHPTPPHRTTPRTAHLRTAALLTTTPLLATPLGGQS
jgi:GntR family transcriptional regulator